MVDKYEIGNRIADARRNAGLTQQEVADELHVTYQAASLWERKQCFQSIFKNSFHRRNLFSHILYFARLFLLGSINYIGDVNQR